LVEITLKTYQQFYIPEAAYIIQNAYKSFPKGTIHIIGIDSEINPENKHIALKLDDYYFICANNGIMSMICSEIVPEQVVEINIHDRIQTSFPVLDIFVKVACHIARGGNLDVIGKAINTIKPIKNILPYINDDKSQIIGNIIYIDNYGNVITNISEKIFNDIGKRRDFVITARRYTFKKIVNKYNEVVDFNSEHIQSFDGTKLAIFNSAGFLEIAII